MMKAYLKIIGTTVLTLTLTVFSPALLQSYVLEGEHIIQIMTDSLGQADSLFVSQKVIFYDVEDRPEILDESNRLDDADETIPHPEGNQTPPDEAAGLTVEHQAIQLDESLRYLFSQAFRSDIISDANQRIFVFNRGRSLTVIDGIISGAVESHFDLYKDLMLFRSRETLSERLVNLGVDVAVSSLGKFEDQPALVIGAEFPDETVPQVWVDKETFQPLRMMIPTTHDYGTGILEIRYADWREIGKMWYPMLIEFIQDGMTVRAIEVNNVQLNPQFSKDVFNIARLMSEYQQTAQTEGQPGQEEGLSEVQKTIEGFKKIFE